MTAAEATPPDATPAGMSDAGALPADGADAVDDGKEAARRAYRESLVAGTPLTGQQLGDRFGYSRSWGRDRILETRNNNHPPGTAAATTPRRRPDRPSRAAPGTRDVVDNPGTAGTPDMPASGRTVAWIAFAVGIAASVAANIMHARATSQSTAAWIGAAFWPVALLLAVEVLTRVRWPARRVYAITRYAGAGLVAVVAATLSYRHMAGLLTTWGEDTFSAHLGPLAVDGLMITAAAALLARRTT